MTDRKKLEELSALSALGVLTAAEENQFRSMLSDAGGAAARQMDAFLEAASLLALDLPPVAPPSGVKIELLRRIKTSSGVRLTAADQQWRSHPVAGVWVKELANDPASDSVMVLFKFDPGTRFPSHLHRGIERCYVVEGSYRAGSAVLRQGDYVESDPGTSDPEIHTEEGCTLLLVMSRRDYHYAPA